MSLTSFIGQKLLPTESGRVSAPPEEIKTANRRSILLATPMRSGTHIARLTGHTEPFAHNPALPVSRAMQVYLNKGLTRILGHRAPRIDTSIRALR